MFVGRIVVEHMVALVGGSFGCPRCFVALSKKYSLPDFLIISHALILRLHSKYLLPYGSYLWSKVQFLIEYFYIHQENVSLRCEHLQSYQNR